MAYTSTRCVSWSCVFGPQTSRRGPEHDQQNIDLEDLERLKPLQSEERQHICFLRIALC
jgi:hypothetical protein